MSDEKTTKPEAEEVTEAPTEATPEEKAPEAKATEVKAEEKAPEAEAEEKPAEETPAEPVDVPQEKVVEEKKADALQEELQKVAEEEVELKELPHRDIEPGMLIRVHERIVDISPKGDKRERVQVFEGMVMGLRSKGIARTMTVRKDSKGFMVEKIYPLASPNIVKIEVKKQYRVRRAKLSYLRGRFRRKLKEVKVEETK